MMKRIMPARRYTLITLLCILVGSTLRAYPNNETQAASESDSNLIVAILGDSNTSIGGDDCSKEAGWTKWFKDFLKPSECYSYARSGATWTNTSATRYDVVENTAVLSDNNVIYNQINRLVEDVKNRRRTTPTLIIIAAGTNDAWFRDKRPGIYTKSAAQAFSSNNSYITGKKVSSVTSLAESVRYGCEMLMEQFPNARIVLLTPMQTVKATYESIKRVGDTIEQCGNRMSIPVIRQDYNTGVYDVRERNARLYTTDGTHTNTRGARLNGRYIARQITTMIW